MLQQRQIYEWLVNLGRSFSVEERKSDLAVVVIVVLNISMKEQNCTFSNLSVVAAIPPRSGRRVTLTSKQPSMDPLPPESGTAQSIPEIVYNNDPSQSLEEADWYWGDISR